MKNALLSLLLMSSTFAVAAETPTFYWDNQEGLKNAKDCQVLPLDSTTLRVSSYTGRSRELIEKFRDKYHNHQTHLVIGSLINLEGGKNKRGYPKVRVVGVNNHKSVRLNRYFSKRNDKGYIHANSIKDLESSVFELRSNTPSSSELNLKNKYAAPVIIGGSLQKFSCEGNAETYVVFGLYSKGENDKPEALVGMSANETKLLRSIRMHTADSAKEMIPALDLELDLEELLGKEEVQIQTEEELEVQTEEAQVEQEEQVEQELEEKEAEEAQKDNTEKSEKPSELAVTTSPRPVARPQQVASTEDKIVCVNEGSLANVRNENLKGKFKAGLNDKVKQYVGFESTSKTARIGGKEYTFIEVQFPNNENANKKSGWIAENLIKSPSDCAPLIAKKAREEANKNRGELVIKSLESKDCCEFPVRGKPRANYYSQGHQSNFAWRRSKGRRAHAGVDLYRHLKEPVYAVAPGKVLRFAYFYDGTYQVTARHTGGFVVRYGEVASRGAKRDGANLKIGDQVGKIGKLQSCCSPMLHFELYSGARRGSLTNKSNRSFPLVPRKWRNKNFQRRADLLDPTPFMRKWQSNSPFPVQ